jgi:NAD(P)-dependent dehydrogenase (short-subunit alcohol dehydrogenase family)
VLADRGWALVIDARDPKALGAAETALAERTTVRAVPGDVTDPDHRHRLITTAIELGGAIDAVVNNASYLGPSPQPPLAHYPLDVVRRVYEVNVFAPLALVQEALPSLRPGGRIVNVTSDAAVEAYEGWGGYGSSKAALEQVTAVLGAERPDLRVYRVDPGDLRTQMHQEAFPDEDISDRPLPEVAVPGLVHLLEGDEPSGRYRAQELVPA